MKQIQPDSATAENRAIIDSDEVARASVKKTFNVKKIASLYCTMVLVSTLAIYFLEHATLINALRTAVIAAVGKSLAANWVTGIFE